MKKLAALAFCLFSVLTAAAGSDVGWKCGRAQSSESWPLGTTFLYHEAVSGRIMIADGREGYCFLVSGSGSGDILKGEAYVIFTNKGGYFFAAVPSATYKLLRMSVVKGRIEKCDTILLEELNGLNSLPDQAVMVDGKLIIGSSVVVLPPFLEVSTFPLKKAPSVAIRGFNGSTFNFLGQKISSVNPSAVGLKIVPGPKGIEKVLNVFK